MAITSSVTVRMKVSPHKHDEFLRILENVTRSVEEQEHDCFLYATWKTANPFEYLMVESYRTEDGRSHHNKLHKHVAEPFFACLEEPPVVETLGDVLFGHIYNKG